jgi:hypothetical protein
LERLLARHIYREPAKFDFQRWSEKYPEESRLLERGFKDSGRSQEIRIYHVLRCIMKSRATKYSAAAVVALAVTLVLLSPFGGPQHGGVLLADVQKKIAETDTMVLRGQKIFSFVADPNISFKFDVVKYMSRAYGHTEEGYIGDKLVYRITFNLPKKQTLIILPIWKKCLKFPCTDEQIRIVEKVNPTGFIDLFLQTDHKELGAGNINGIDVEGFEFQSMKSLENILPKFLFDIHLDKASVWIGVKELLPIRIEGDLIIGKSFLTAFTELRLHEFCVLENYNVELDENIFNTDIPEGYSEIKITDFIPVKAALAGLSVASVPIGLVIRRNLRKRKDGRAA